MFHMLFVRKNFFHLNLRAGSPENFGLPPIFGGKYEKNMEKLGKIGRKWHRGNFSSNVVISETGCGNFP